MSGISLFLAVKKLFLGHYKSNSHRFFTRRCVILVIIISLEIVSLKKFYVPFYV